MKPFLKLVRRSALTIQGLFEPYYTKGATDFIVRLLLAVWIKYSLLVELLAALSVPFLINPKRTNKEWKTASCVEGDPCSSNWCKRYALWSRKIGFFLSFFPKRETWEFDSRSIHVQQSLSMLELLMAVPTTRCLKVDVSMFPRVASSPETASHASS